MFITKARRNPPRRRFVDTPSGDVAWQATHRIADANYPLFRRLMLDAWGNWRDHLDVAAIFSALVAGNTSGAVALAQNAWMGAANDFYLTARQVMMDTLEAGANAVIPFTEDLLSEALGGPVSISFDAPASLRVQQVINQEAGRLITQIGETERMAIRDLILAAARDGRSPFETARDIRQFIGVTAPQAQTLIRVRSAMQAAGVRPDRIEARIAVRTRKMINYRARVIARHESIRAAQAGAQETWKEASAQGLINPDQFKRRFIVTDDERTCPICIPMDGQERGLEDPFESPYNGARALNPPIHIQCRCAMRLVKVD